jgi:iron complex transport system ATP-binding protein
MSAVVFTDAHVRFGANRALDGVSCAFARGAVTGIVGPNGAGKTTLIRAAAGLVPLSSGAATVFDRAVAAWPREALARRVAYLPQGGEAAWPLPAREVVALGRMPHGAALSRLPAADTTAVDAALARADASAFATRRVDALSAGERARVLFARALATGADVLLADEPAAHLDPAHQLRMIELLHEEASRGAAVIVTLHELALAARCDRLIVLDGGRVAAEGEPAVALSDDVLARVFGVTAARATAHDGTAVPVPWSVI